MKKEIRNIALVGAGRMGHGIAETFIQTGKEVSVFDLSERVLQQAVESITYNLHELSEWGALPPGDIQLAIDRLHLTTRLEDVASNADVVIEAVPEDLELKRQVFNRLDGICPERTILASNSSTFGPSEYARATNRPDRVVGAHYFYPPHLIPLVEIVRSPSTSDSTVETIYDLLKSSGKTPIVVQKEVPGFIANRLQYALQREAFYLVEQGFASPQDIDIVTKTSFGPRLPLAGIIEMLEIQGTGDYELLSTIWKYIFPHLCSSKEPLPLLIEKLKRRELGSKTGQGFYDWTPESKDARRKELRKDLFELLHSFSGQTGQG